jgi:hypothetical protein
MPLRIAFAISLLVHLFLIGALGRNVLHKGKRGQKQAEAEKTGQHDKNGLKDNMVEVTIIPPPAKEEKAKDLPADKDGLKFKTHREVGSKDCKHWYGGIGIVLNWDQFTTYYHLAVVYPGYPAAKAGLKVGDQVIGFIERGDPGTTIVVNLVQHEIVTPVSIVRDKICISDEETRPTHNGWSINH